MILTEMDFHADVLHWVASDHTRRDLLEKSLFDRREEVARNCSTDHGIHEQEIMFLVVVMVFQMREALFGHEFFGLRPFRERIHPNMHFAKLPRATGLLLVPVAAVAIRLNRLTVGN